MSSVYVKSCAHFTIVSCRDRETYSGLLIRLRKEGLPPSFSHCGTKLNLSAEITITGDYYFFTVEILLD